MGFFVSGAATATRKPALLARWRLVLGRQAEAHGISCGTPGAESGAAATEELIDFLFETRRGVGGDGDGSGGAGGPDDGDGGERTGGLEASRLTVPEWVDKVHQLFPRSVKEVMERELVRRRGIAELLDRPDVLERIEPNRELVKTLITHKDLISPNTRGLARKIIAQVIEELKRKLVMRVEQALTGAIRRDKHSPRQVFRNLDLRTTLRRNLKNWDEERERLLVDKIYFHAAERRRRPWHVIVLVDQSGSMLDSAIFSTVMASIFAGLPGLRTSLVLFDTDVVDLSDKVSQPVDVLLSVQLGGGTDITRALGYAATLVTEPGRSIVVLISDFYEGRRESELLTQTQTIVDAGVRIVGLAALGYDARPEFNRKLAKKLRKLGVDVLVCTPEHLADCMARIIKG
jgi:Mg-chelatase subunit ChlD